jgi:hypothetical protein
MTQTDASAPPRRRRRVLWAVGGVALFALIAVPVGLALGLVVQTQVGRVTVVHADGAERTVHWRDYPGVAGLDPQEVIDGPSVEEGYAAGEAMVAEVRAAITAKFGLTWAGPPPSDERFDPFHENVENEFGGESMLSTINSQGSVTTDVPRSWQQKQRLLAVVAEVAAGYGFSAPVLDTAGYSGWTDQQLIRDLGGTTPQTQAIVGGTLLGPTGQWLFFSFLDMSKDLDGSITERLAPSDGNGGPINSFSLGYGANALLPEGDDAEFERRMQPFEGLTPPEPLET